jgi:hypothetical protein
MRISSLLILLGVLTITPLASADVLPAPGTCVDHEVDGCSCRTEQVCNHNAPEDMSVSPVRDLSAPRDLASPPDARLEHHRRRQARGRGLVLLSGLSALGVIALRRRYRTMRPTPAESALAASAMRKDS